jgi:putative transposase
MYYLFDFSGLMIVNLNIYKNTMPEKFNSKYRLSSARMPGWDYASHAAYFITICTAGHKNYFWDINHPKPVETPCMASLIGMQKRNPAVETPCMASLQYIQLSELGKIADSEWVKTPGLRPDMNLILGKYVVMPDHFHAIVIIGLNEYDRCYPDSRIHCSGKFGPQRKNLGSVVRGFKSAVTMYARKNNILFGWQSRYYDRVIRNENEFIRISGYIDANPVKWVDKHNSRR